jgi:uncharacterized repeat protein (TIGR03806 family)
VKSFVVCCATPALLAVIVSCSSSAKPSTDGAAGNGGSTGTDASDAAGDQMEAGGTFAACAPPTDITNPPALLSDTGCMDPAHPTQLAAAVIPYEVNSPLWSDGANKARGMRLPSGGKIHVKNCAANPSECPQGSADDGKWVFPVGTVMVKSFMFDGKLVETRLFMRADAQTYVGYSYRWDEAQTAATLVPDDRVEVQFNTGLHTVDWHYPNRVDCMTCHTNQASGILGPETDQMNRTVGGANQIDTLQAMDLFDAPVPQPYAAPLVTPYPSQAGSPPAGATVEDRARSYLHANCAFCHRPDADFNLMDLRRGVSFKDMLLCDLSPTKGDQGVPGAQLLTPTDPQHSIVWLRMSEPSPDNGRMPKIASYVVDQNAVDLIGAWITSISSCPP